MDYINLIGAEAVQSAGHTMQRAADEMRHSAMTIAEALETHRRWSDDWLSRLAAVLKDDITVRRQS